MRGERVGRLLCYVLRHEPGKIGISLDKHGWAKVSELIKGLQGQGVYLSQEDLERIVEEDEKQRYSFDSLHQRIRCNQGHSIPVDVEPRQADPPKILYHGTSQGAVGSILKEGIRKMSRLYVQLSWDAETARRVGQRHGKPVVLQVEAGRMAADGYLFFLSVNEIWMTDHVPPEYIRVLP